MPPHNLFDGFDSDCQAVSMGQLFNSILSSSINSLTPMCNDSAQTCNDNVEPRVYSPTYPMNDNQNHQPSSVSSSTSKTGVLVSTSPDPRRPPLNPIKPKATGSNRSRKRVGLSISVPSPPSDPHCIPTPLGDDPPPLISCSKNVDLRRKSLSERHFFRPVSEDEESSCFSWGKMKQ